MLEQKRLGNHGTGTARSEQPSQGSDEMDEQDDQIAHHGILAGREVPPNYGRNNNSPATGSENGPLNGIAAFNVGNYQYLFFVAGTGHVHEFFYNNIRWADADLTQLSKTAPVNEGAILNNIAAVAIPGTKKMRVYLLNNANHIFQLASSDNVTWSGSDLTKKSKGPQPNSNTNLFALVDSTNKQVSVYYESGGRVNQMTQLPSGWTNEDLTALTGGPLEFDLTSMAGFSLNGGRYLFYNARVD